MAANLPGGAVSDPRTDQNLRALAKQVNGPAGGALTGTYPNPTLAAATKELFPQLVTAANRKINFAESKVKFSASKASEVKEVTHGLGATPLFVGITTLAAGPSETVIGWRVTSLGSTKFSVYGSSSAELSTELPILWVAIG